jgi:hypothetical protein
LSFRDVEDLLAERGIIVSYEAVRQWCRKFGPDYARRLKRRQGRLGDTWFLDEVFVLINGLTPKEGAGPRSREAQDAECRQLPQHCLMKAAMLDQGASQLERVVHVAELRHLQAAVL